MCYHGGPLGGARFADFAAVPGISWKNPAMPLYRSVVATLASAAAVAAGCLGVASATAAPGDSVECPPQGGYQIQISGAVDCSYAYDVASAYDPGGDKFQAVYEFDCYSGTAEIRPIVLQCVSADGEFAVSQA